MVQCRLGSLGGPEPRPAFRACHVDGAVTEHGQALEHLPRREGESFSRIFLTVGELRRVRQKLAEARDGWVDICRALSEEGKRNGSV